MAVMNVGGRSFSEKSEESFRSAADRWGCELCVITDHIVPLHHFWQKCLVHTLFPTDCRVLQLDADMVIRFDAPSPFDLVPPGTFGGVCENPPTFRAQGPHHQYTKFEFTLRNYAYSCVTYWSNLLELPRIFELRECMNGGLWLYEPKLHGRLLQEVFNHGIKVKYSADHCPEQTILSLLLKHQDVPVCWLPYLFNSEFPPRNRAVSSNGPMSSYIHHFPGKNKNALRFADWQNRPPHRANEIISRLPADGAYAEVGALYGETMARVLSARPRVSGICVDPWAAPTQSYIESGDLISRWTAKDFFAAEDAARATLRFCVDRCDIMKTVSTAAAAQLSDGSLDVVFLDAEHSESAVTEDIASWLPKVKTGGWIGGHDWQHPRFPLWGVDTAVLKFFDRSRVELGEDYTWFVRVE